MDQGVLYFYFRKNAFDSLGKTIEIVDTNYEHVGHTSIAQIGKHTEPEVCPLAFRNVHTQKIFTPFSIDAQDVVHGPGRDSPFIFLQFCAGANILFLSIVARSLSLAASGVTQYCGKKCGLSSLTWHTATPSPTGDLSTEVLCRGNYHSKYNSSRLNTQSCLPCAGDGHPQTRWLRI